MNIIQYLKEGLDSAQLWEGERWLDRQEVLVPAGAVDRRLYFVEEGSLRVFFEDEGEAQIVRLGYQGNFIAALDSYISGGPTEYCMQALKRCHLRYVSRDTFESFLASAPAYRARWQELLELLVYQLMEREQDLLTTSPEARYRRVLARSPQLFQEVPHKYIASYLRMAPETLSRLKKS